MRPAPTTGHMVSLVDLSVGNPGIITRADIFSSPAVGAVPGILVALGTTPDVWEHSLMIISRPRLEKLAGTDGIPHPPAHARR